MRLRRLLVALGAIETLAACGDPVKNVRLWYLLHGTGRPVIDHRWVQSFVLANSPDDPGLPGTLFRESCELGPIIDHVQTLKFYLVAINTGAQCYVGVCAAERDGLTASCLEKDARGTVIGQIRVTGHKAPGHTERSEAVSMPRGRTRGYS